MNNYDFTDLTCELPVAKKRRVRASRSAACISLDSTGIKTMGNDGTNLSKKFH